MSVGQPEEDIQKEQGEEITRLQQQVKSLQEKKEGQWREKTKKRGSGEQTRRDNEIEAEEEPWYEATNTSHWEKLWAPRKIRANPFTE